MSFSYKTLTIAGSDCSGGAGIQADLKTFSALGCYGMSVITALTAQNTQGVQDVFPSSLDCIERQIDSIFTDINVDSVKTGMLFDSEIIELVAQKLQQYQVKNFVLDPVMISKNGSRLLSENSIYSLKKFLIPLATIVTPNIHEAEALSDIKINNYDDMILAGKKILDLGCSAVLVKGGHMEIDNVTRDYLIHYKDGVIQIKFFEYPRIITDNTHGTGCTLSAAICSYSSMNYNIIDAVEKAGQYLHQALISAQNYQLGKDVGCGPVDHLFTLQIQHCDKHL